MKYEPHPAAEIFPMMNDEEFAGLVEDIREHGLREPIILYDGKVLDGRNRLKACEQTGTELRFEEWPNGEDPRAYVVSKNLHRRHLSEGQRSVIAARMANATGGGDRMSDHSANLQSGEITASRAAEMLNVGERSIYNAKTVLRDGTEEDVAAVESGQSSVSAVAKRVRANRINADAEQSQQINPTRTIRVPTGRTVEDLIRAGMGEESEGKSLEDAAKAVGLPDTTYRQGRDIVLLSDMSLGGRDGELVDAVLTDMNERRHITAPYERVKHIIGRVWGFRNHRTEKTVARRIEDFERAFGHIVQACSAADQIEIPHIGEDRARRAVGELREALRHARQLQSKLEELYQ